MEHRQITGRPKRNCGGRPKKLANGKTRNELTWLDSITKDSSSYHWRPPFARCSYNRLLQQNARLQLCKGARCSYKLTLAEVKSERQLCSSKINLAATKLTPIFATMNICCCKLSANEALAHVAFAVTYLLLFCKVATTTKQKKRMAVASLQSILSAAK